MMVYFDCLEFYKTAVSASKEATYKFEQKDQAILVSF